MNLMRPVAVLVVALLLAPACKRSTPSTDPLEKVPGSSSAVVFGPSLLEATSQLKALVQRLESTQGAQRTSHAADDVTQRFGFDPFTAEGLTAAGFKPDGTFVIAVDGDGAGNTWFLPVVDGDKALATLERFAKQADQADRVKGEKVGELVVKTFGRPFGSREVPVMAAALSGPFLVVARGPKGSEHVTHAVALKREESFAQGAVMKALGARIPSTPIRFVVDASHAGDISSNAKAASRLVKFLAGGLAPGASGLDVTVIAELTDEKRDAVLQGLFPAGATLPLSAVLDGEVIAAGQGTLAFDTAKNVANSVDPASVNALRQQAARIGMGLEEDLMSLTDGHYAGALFLAPTTEISAAFKEGQPLQNQLMRFAPFLVMMRPKSGQTPQQVLDFLRDRFTTRGMKVAALDGEAGAIHATWPNQPAWRSYQAANVEGVILVGGGSEQRFRKALGNLRSKAAPAKSDDGMALLTRDQTSTLVLRLPVIAARLDEVTKADLGDGADALMARTLISRARQLASIGKDITLELRPDGKQLAGAIHLPLQQASK